MVRAGVTIQRIGQSAAKPSDIISEGSTTRALCSYSQAAGNAGSDMKRFWDKTIKIENGCIEWTSCKNQWGYGVFALSSKEKYVLAHRVAWFLSNRIIPDGMILMHSCDNPACVNIEHLQLGTQAENIADKVRKNRQAKGSKHGNSKLTEKLVETIKSSSYSQRKLAKQFNVSQATIHMVKSGKYWKHV